MCTVFVYVIVYLWICEFGHVQEFKYRQDLSIYTRDSLFTNQSVLMFIDAIFSFYLRPHWYKVQYIFFKYYQVF